MAEYELTFHFLGGVTAKVSTGQQPVKIEDYLQKLTHTAFQSFIDEDGKATLINMRNVVHATIKMVEEY